MSSATTATTWAIGPDETPGAHHPRLLAADFDLGAAAFFAAGLCEAADFAFTPAPPSAAFALAGGFAGLPLVAFAGLRSRAAGLPSRSAIRSRACVSVTESGLTPLGRVALTLPQLT